MESTPEERRNRYRIEIKLTEAEKDLIARGAAARKQGLSQFVRSAAEDAARAALGEASPKA